jgi:hypothetical protein
VFCFFAISNECLPACYGEEVIIRAAFIQLGTSPGKGWNWTDTKRLMFLSFFLFVSTSAW